MAVSEKHYRREQKGDAFIGPLICSGTPTVGSSFVDRFQPALLGKFNGLAPLYVDVRPTGRHVCRYQVHSNGGLNEPAFVSVNLGHGWDRREWVQVLA